MKIPKEIQDLMPERKGEEPKNYVEAVGYELTDDEIGFNQALQEVEAVLPQIIALAEKRGAEGERERVKALLGQLLQLK